MARSASASATSRKADWIAFSYCAIWMSRWISATSRLACRRPASKIGRRICGTKLHAPEPPSNRPSSELLALPAVAVSVMRGKKAARAAPMLALAAISARSAWATSGRRASTSEGTPAGSSVTAARRALSASGSSSAGTPAPTISASAFSSCATSAA